MQPFVPIASPERPTPFPLFMDFPQQQPMKCLAVSAAAPDWTAEEDQELLRAMQLTTGKKVRTIFTKVIKKPKTYRELQEHYNRYWKSTISQERLKETIGTLYVTSIGGHRILQEDPTTPVKKRIMRRWTIEEDTEFLIALRRFWNEPGKWELISKYFGYVRTSNQYLAKWAGTLRFKVDIDKLLGGKKFVILEYPEGRKVEFLNDEGDKKPVDNPSRNVFPQAVQPTQPLPEAENRMSVSYLLNSVQS